MILISDLLKYNIYLCTNVVLLKICDANIVVSATQRMLRLPGC